MNKIPKDIKLVQQCLTAEEQAQTLKIKKALVVDQSRMQIVKQICELHDQLSFLNGNLTGKMKAVLIYILATSQAYNDLILRSENFETGISNLDLFLQVLKDQHFEFWCETQAIKEEK